MPMMNNTWQVQSRIDKIVMVFLPLRVVAIRCIKTAKEKQGEMTKNIAMWEDKHFQNQEC